MKKSWYKRIRVRIGHLFLSYFSMLLIPTLIMVLAYSGVETLVSQQAVSISKVVINQISHELDTTLKEAERLANLVLHNQRIGTHAKKAHPVNGTGIYDLVEIAQDLKNYSLASVNIQDFFVYFPKSDTIMNPTAAYRPELYFDHIYTGTNVSSTEIIDELGQYSTGKISSIHLQSGQSRREHLLYIKTLPGQSSKPLDVAANICILIDISSLQSIFQEYADILPGSKAVALSSNNETMFSFSPDFSPEVLPEFSVADEDFSHTTLDSGKLISTTVDSQTMPGLRYVIWQPLSYVLAPARSIRNQVLLLLVLYVVLGVLMSTFLSERASAPIRSLLGTIAPFQPESKKKRSINYYKDLQSIEQAIQHMATESKSTEQQLSQVIPIARNNVLEALLKGRFEQPSQALAALEEYAISFSGDYFFVLLLDQVFSSDKKDPYGKITAKLAISQVIETLLTPCFTYHIVDTADEEYCVLINHTSFVARAEIATLALQMRDQLFYDKLLEVSVYVGTCQPGLSGATQSYQQAVQASYYRAVIPGNTVIEYANLEKTTNVIRFDCATELSLETKLLASEYKALVDQLETLYGTYLLNETIDPYAAHCLVLQIVSIFLQTAVNVGYDIYQSQNYEMLDELFRLDAPIENSLEWLKSLAKELCDFISHNYWQEEQGLQQQIELLLHEEISNPNLSQSYLADKLGISAPYLSVLFKEKFGVGMVDYINTNRCNLAKTYLEETDFTLAEIAEKIGVIDSSAVIRIFKKYCGMTPGQYRKAFSEL